MKMALANSEPGTAPRSEQCSSSLCDLTNRYYPQLKHWTDIRDLLPNTCGKTRCRTLGRVPLQLEPRLERGLMG